MPYHPIMVELGVAVEADAAAKRGTLCAGIAWLWTSTCPPVDHQADLGMAIRRVLPVVDEDMAHFLRQFC
jgi:hypothetical protein